MYSLILARRKTLLLWGSLEAIFGGLAWKSYRNPDHFALVRMRGAKHPQWT